MATQKQIGPRIGLYGEREYREQLSKIISKTKSLDLEMKALTTSFDKDSKSLKQNAEQRRLLNERITQEQKALELNNYMLKQAEQKYGVGSKQAQQYKDVINKTQIEINKLNQELKNTPNNVQLVGEKMEAMGKKMSDIGQSLSDFGSKLTRTFTLPIVGAFSASAKSAIDWESAFAGVKKTVDETVDSNGNLITSYADIEVGLKGLATQTGSTKEEIAGVAEVAGQLGISADNVVDFTKTMIMLGDTTNMTAEEASMNIAQMLNIMGDGSDTVDNFGSAVVYLGNNFATTESKIVDMATNLASSGKLAGLSTPEILALATAMSSVGIEAAAGGTAMTQTLTAIEKEVANFGAGTENKLATIAQIANMSAEEFANAWENEPIVAVQSFISGLGQLDEKGESATLILDELGMSGVRQSNMLKSLALASETLTGAVDGSTQAYNENVALSDEAQKRYETMAVKIHQMKERIMEVAISIGEMLMPYIEKAVSVIESWVAKWQQLNPEQQKTILKIAGLIAVIGPAISIIGKLTSGIGGLIGSVGKITKFIGGLSLSFNPWILVIGGAIAIIGVLVAHMDELKEAGKKMAEMLTESIEEMGNNIQKIFNAVVGAVVNFIRGIIDWGKNMWTNLSTTFTNMKKGISEKMTAIKESVIGALRSAITYIIGLPTEALKWGADIMTKLGDGIKNMGTSVYNAVSEAVSSAVQFLKDLPGKAWQWGKDMLSNFIGGMKNKQIEVRTATTDIARDVKARLGFSEPETGPLSNFHTYAPDMMKLYAQGIRENAWLVQTAVDSVASGIATEMNSVQPTMTSGAYRQEQAQVMNGGTFTFNIQSNNPREVADEVDRLIQNKYMRKVEAW